MTDTTKLRVAISRLKLECSIDARYENSPGGLCFIPQTDQQFIVEASPATVSALLDELDRLRAELQARQWQPIETAPKDGTLILLGRHPLEDCEAISVPGFWQEGWEDSIDDMGCFVDCQFDVFHPPRRFGNPKYQTEGSQPTHWMPLPPAPEQGEEECKC